MAKRNDGYVVQETRPVTKDGKRIGTRVFLTNPDTGEYKHRVYLNPNGKGRKYVKEIKDKTRYTNTGTVKKGKDGLPLPFTRECQAYRSGYLDAQKDSARIYNSKKKG